MKYIFESIKSYLLVACLIVTIGIQVSTSFLRDNFSLAMIALGGVVIFYVGTQYGRKQERDDNGGDR